MPYVWIPHCIGEVSEACPGLAASAQACQKNRIWDRTGVHPKRSYAKQKNTVYIYIIHINGQVIHIESYIYICPLICMVKSSF